MFYVFSQVHWHSLRFQKEKALGALKHPRLFRATINLRLAGDSPDYGNKLAGSARARRAHDHVN
jgi:hypothetical protein